MSTDHIAVSGFSASGILYQASSPANIFAEIKDNGYPVTAFRNHLCCIGGNWIGEKAKLDRGPRDTFLREVDEELSFDKPTMTTVELVDLGLAEKAAGYSAQPCSKDPSDEDRADLNRIKHAIHDNAVHFMDNIQRVPKVVFDRADPNNKKNAYSTLNSFFIVPLSDGQWETLTRLQKAFGNLSNESFSLTTDLYTLLTTHQRCSWGYDRIIQEFFLSAGLKEARDMYMVPDVEVEWLGRPLGSYIEYLGRFTPEKRP